MNKQEIINQFCIAFTKGRWKTMTSLFHKDVKFNDVIFKNLNYKEATYM